MGASLTAFTFSYIASGVQASQNVFEVQSNENIVGHVWAGDKKPEEDKPEEDKPETEKPEEAAKDETEETESKSSDKKDEKKTKDKKKKKKKKLISDIVKELEKSEGLFTFYRDPKTGTLRMEVREDQIDQEFIYFSQTADGVPEGGHFRGQYRRQKILKFVRHYERLELIEVNPYLYFDPDSALAKAKDANTSPAVMAVIKVEAKNKAGNKYLFRADGLFVNEILDQVKPSSRPGQKPGSAFSLGKLSKAKTKISRFKNYPENTEIIVDYVYYNPTPAHYGKGPEITNARNVTVSLRHAFIAMPENDFKPRFDDPRVGYFLDYVNNMTDRSATPWRDMITRWNLVKQNPQAAISEPIEPIVWWIENTTPVDIRPTIKAAGEAWNIAFEAAGFKNALVVKEQPDDADWDAGDIRYNVLRWTSSSQPLFGGYGPSFSNPRTGQILGADIMLEFSFLTNRINAANVFESAALNLNTARTSATELSTAIMGMNKHLQNCGLAGHLHMNNMLGKTLAKLQGATPEVERKIVEESIYYLILHEIGHTLGLNHNMKSTQSRSYATAHDISEQSEGLISSVMDYPAINFAPPRKDQAHYYTVRPGAYDIWAIQYGYNPDLDDETKRKAHLDRSTEPTLAFGNDGDDMRAPGKGIDPRVNIYDMTDDAISYAADRLALDQAALAKLKDKFTKSGQSYQELRNAYLILTADIAWQGRVTSRYIGGVYVDRAVAGQTGATAPYQPVPEEKQRIAMQLLRDNIFAPDAFAADPALLQYLAVQRRGFALYGHTEDPKIHARAGLIQADILAHLMHPITLLRMTDTSLYGNTYSVNEMLSDLSDAIFEADSRGVVNSFRQELQVHYVHMLINVMRGNGYDYVARSSAFSNLTGLRKDLARWRGDAATRAHREHLSFIINKALEVHEG